MVGGMEVKYFINIYIGRYGGLIFSVGGFHGENHVTLGITKVEGVVYITFLGDH